MKIEFKQKLNIKSKIAISFSIALVGVIFLLYVFILPSKRAITDMRRSVYEMNVEMEKKYQKTLDLKRLNEKMKKIDPEVAAINNAFLSRERDVEFITALEAVAIDNGVQQSISLGQLQTDAKAVFAQMPITLEVFGGYQEVRKYLEGLENLSYYLIIKDLELGRETSTTQEGGGRSGLRATINATTYWR